MKYEKDDKIPFEESGIKFWPKREDNCYKENMKEVSNNKCIMEFENPEEDFIFIGKDEKYGIHNFS